MVFDELVFLSQTIEISPIMFFFSVRFVVFVDLARCIDVKPIFHSDSKTFALGPCVRLDPQRERLVSKNAGIKVALEPRRKFLALGMYISYFWCQFYLRWVANLQWNMGLRLDYGGFGAHLVKR